MLDLKGRGVLIAGAKRVGAVVARRIADEGASVAITYRSSIEEAESLRDEIAGRVASKTALIQANLADEADAQLAVATAARELGGLHFAVNLASGFPRTPLAELNEAAWERSMADAKASYLVTLHAARAMMANEGPTRGHIVLFSDWAALHAPYRRLPSLHDIKGRDHLHDTCLRSRTRPLRHPGKRDSPRPHHATPGPPSNLLEAGRRSTWLPSPASRRPKRSQRWW